jgi:hypothetical protein
LSKIGTNRTFSPECAGLDLVFRCSDIFLLFLVMFFE